MKLSKSNAMSLNIKISTTIIIYFDTKLHTKVILFYFLTKINSLFLSPLNSTKYNIF